MLEVILARALTPPVDTDGDGVPDFLDKDSDDSLPDGEDAGGTARDTEEDGSTELAEVTWGTDPADPSSLPGEDVVYADVLGFAEVQRVP